MSQVIEDGAVSRVRGAVGIHKVANLTTHPGERFDTRLETAVSLFAETNREGQRGEISTRIEAILAEAQEAGESADLDPETIAQILHLGIIDENTAYKLGLGSFVLSKFEDAGEEETLN